MYTLHELSLAAIAYRCGQETDRFWQRASYDPRFCFELFRRALVEPLLDNSKEAWAFVYRQYHRQVTFWVKGHRLFPQTDLEPEALADLALEKMWVSFASTPGKFGQFPLSDVDKGLKSLLRYLQMCVHSLVIDSIEASPARELPETVRDKTAHADTLLVQEFWEAIFQRLRSDKERLVVDASYVYGLKPRQIFARYPDTFRDVKEIHRIKENVLARLRRDESLRSHWLDAA